MTRALVFLVCFAVCLVAKTALLKRVLIVVGDPAVTTTHASFFSDLKKNGFIVTVKEESDKTTALERNGEYQYDHLILFAPSFETFGKRYSIREVLDFVDSGRNLLMVAAPTLSKRLFDLGMECGVDFESAGSKVLDHFHSVDAADPSLLVVEPQSVVQEIFDKRKPQPLQRPLLYRGIGHSVAPDQDLVTVALNAHATSYSWGSEEVEESSQLLAGKDISLISLMQTTHNARVAVVGSLEFFSDAFFESTVASGRQGGEGLPSGNREFCLDLALWTFQSLGVLQTKAPRHYNTKTGVQPSMYTIKDPIHFELDIMEYVVDRWRPYRADDVQLEYYMMSPYIRTLLRDNGNGTFSADLQAPDVHGVFKFLVTYRRPGYSYIDLTEMAPIRPFRHDEYERFIVQAYPYYASVFSMMIGFWLFGILYLYQKD